jgi:cerevisin
LQRISHREPIEPGRFAADLDYEYIYDRSAGRGVDIYIIDTGIQIDHVGSCTFRLPLELTPGGQPDFEGRARWGATL